MTPELAIQLVAVAVCVWAVLYVLFWRRDQFDAYAARRCECDKHDMGGFTPNPHDDRCGVCRGIEPLPVAADQEVRNIPMPTHNQGPECDFGCGSREYPAKNPFVQIRQRRPSDQVDMCCVMWGHADCAGAPVGSLPSISESGGVATPEQWGDWIETGEGRKMGFHFLT